MSFMTEILRVQFKTLTFLVSLSYGAGVGIGASDFLLGLFAGLEVFVVVSIIQYFTHKKKFRKGDQHGGF